GSTNRLPSTAIPVAPDRQAAPVAELEPEDVDGQAIGVLAALAAARESSPGPVHVVHPDDRHVMPLEERGELCEHEGQAAIEHAEDALTPRRLEAHRADGVCEAQRRGDAFRWAARALEGQVTSFQLPAALPG